MAEIIPNTHTNFSCATGHAGLENDFIGGEAADSLGPFRSRWDTSSEPSGRGPRSVDLVGKRENDGEEAGGVTEVCL